MFKVGSTITLILLGPPVTSVSKYFDFKLNKLALSHIGKAPTAFDVVLTAVILANIGVRFLKTLSKTSGEPRPAKAFLLSSFCIV